jgi:hypothetical protein
LFNKTIANRKQNFFKALEIFQKIKTQSRPFLNEWKDDDIHLLPKPFKINFVQN